MRSLWDWFTPLAPCELKERVGIVGDGGKWVCDVARYERPRPAGRACVIYSFGVRGDSSFEAAMLQRTPCEVFGFDFSVDSMASGIAGSPRAHFMRKGLGAHETAQLWTLRQIMAHYKHSFIDILKVDIEGSEFDVFEELLAELPASDGALPFEQLQLEVHHSAAQGMTSRVFELLRGLRSMGVVAFMSESNNNPCAMGSLPHVVEYSFYNLRSWFDASRWPCED